MPQSVNSLFPTTGRGSIRAVPAHFAHLLFAHESLQRHLSLPSDKLSRAYIALGAQGPDLFFHNRRTKPSGLHYGSALHRKRFGSFVASMLSSCRHHGLSPDNPLVLHSLAYLTHGILDRHTHPFINYFGGWGTPRPGLPHTHAFFERIVDCLLMKQRWGRHPSAYDFSGELEAVLSDDFAAPEASRPSGTAVDSRAIPPELRHLLAESLLATFHQAESDDALEQRIANAFDDAIGFYRYTNRITAEKLRQRFLSGQWNHAEIKRGLALLHPIRLPSELDYLNERHREWLHPCEPKRERRDSFWDLYDAAHSEAESALSAAIAYYRSPAESPGQAELAATIGDSDLSDPELNEAPCRKVYSDPLPFDDVLEAIVAEIAGA